MRRGSSGVKAPSPAKPRPGRHAVPPRCPETAPSPGIALPQAPSAQPGIGPGRREYQEGAQPAGYLDQYSNHRTHQVPHHVMEKAAARHAKDQQILLTVPCRVVYRLHRIGIVCLTADPGCLWLPLLRSRVSRSVAVLRLASVRIQAAIGSPRRKVPERASRSVPGQQRDWPTATGVQRGGTRRPCRRRSGARENRTTPPQRQGFARREAEHGSGARCRLAAGSPV